MKPKLDLFGRVTGYVITVEEMKVLRKVAQQVKGSKLKFDALAIFRECELIGDEKV